MITSSVSGAGTGHCDWIGTSLHSLTSDQCTRNTCTHRLLPDSGLAGSAATRSSHRTQRSVYSIRGNTGSVHAAGKQPGSMLISFGPSRPSVRKFRGFPLYYEFLLGTLTRACAVL